MAILLAPRPPLPLPLPLPLAIGIPESELLSYDSDSDWFLFFFFVKLLLLLLLLSALLAIPDLSCFLFFLDCRMFSNFFILVPNFSISSLGSFFKKISYTILLYFLISSSALTKSSVLIKLLTFCKVLAANNLKLSYLSKSSSLFDSNL